MTAVEICTSWASCLKFNSRTEHSFTNDTVYMSIFFSFHLSSTQVSNIYICENLITLWTKWIEDNCFPACPLQNWYSAAWSKHNCCVKCFSGCTFLPGIRASLLKFFWKMFVLNCKERKKRGKKEPRVQTRDMPPIVRIIMMTILLLILKGNFFFFFFLILCAKDGQGCWTLLNCCWKTVYSESRQISFDNDSESGTSEACFFMCFIQSKYYTKLTL